jgi:hypothetical protein
VVFFLTRQPYDEAKYSRVLDVCCLRPDIDVLPAGAPVDLLSDSVLGMEWCS